MRMGSSLVQTDEQREELLAKGQIPMGIGKGTVIRKAIIDKNARIGENVQVSVPSDCRPCYAETDVDTSS
jgi:glucose-1-phosphate adenylyltransferase